MSKDRNISHFVSSHSDHIVELDKKTAYEDQLAELELLDEKHKFYAVGMIDVALIVYGEVFVRCDEFEEDKTHTWVFKGTFIILLSSSCWGLNR
jgi:hypothetical protein